MGQEAMTPARYLVAVDPGKTRCGLAVFRDRVLIHASEPEKDDSGSMAQILVKRAEGAIADPAQPVDWVSEVPQDYDGKSGRKDRLEDLREVVQTIILWRSDIAMRPVTLFRPQAWKGNVPKEAHHRRIVAALAPSEVAIIERLPRTRDALDAVGLGLFRLRRLDRGGRRF
jgi:hypothetical protein